MTNTLLSGSRYPHKWFEYFEMIVKGYTLPKIAVKLQIHISTAFYWRHKILYAIRSIGYQALKGFFEKDETKPSSKKAIRERKGSKKTDEYFKG